MKKATIILIAAVLILAVGVTSTVAWITSTTNTLTNEFTVGDVDITLTEPAWDTQADHLIVPGKTLVKDPKVTILADSEKCYVFVKIETAADLEFCIDYTVDAAWTALGAAYPGVYWTTAEKSGTDTVIPVLTDNQVTVPTTIVAADLASVDTALDTMKITAYAIQFDYLTTGTAEAAWNILTTP